MHTMSDNPEYIFFVKPTCLGKILAKDCNGDYLAIPIPYEMRESIPPSRIKVPVFVFFVQKRLTLQIRNIFLLIMSLLKKFHLNVFKMLC